MIPDPYHPVTTPTTVLRDVGAHHAALVFTGANVGALAAAGLLVAILGAALIVLAVRRA